MFPALHRKLIRDLFQMKGQALAISLVIASGMGTFVMSVSTLQSLRNTMQEYYDQHRFAQVFAHVKRAPLHVRDRIAAIPGVSQVQTRVVVTVNVSVRGMREPALGRIISVPEDRPPGLNSLYLREGRQVALGRAGEVVVNEAFAKAHGLHSGDHVEAVINGRFESLRIVGVALSPEYIYQIRPGDILPDDRRFAVFWMGERQLAPAFDMEGAFNDVSLTLMPGASEAEVIRRLDEIVDQYGGLGAYGRDDHPSHEFVSNEIRELRGMAMVAPTIFLLVAAFLLNVVLTRLVGTQREQIATLKAFGYSNLNVAWHYLQMVIVIEVVGVVLGTAVGIWMGRGIAVMYEKFFHFPSFQFTLPPSVFGLGSIICLSAGILGTIGAVRRAASLPPAQAMRPEPPADYRPTVIERLGLQRLLSPAGRMILRELERRPFKAASSCIGIAMAMAVLVVGSFMKDSIDYVMELQFTRAQRQQAMVTFTEPTSGRAIPSILQLPGVQAVEPFRAVAVRFRHEHHVRRVGVTGLAPDMQLFRLLDLAGQQVNPDGPGLWMSAKLGEILNVRPGDEVTMEVLESTRPVVQIVVSGLIDDFSGSAAYMRMADLHRLLGEQDQISGAYLAADQRQMDELFQELKQTPAVAGVALKEASRQSFEDTVAENLLRMRLFNIMFAVIIAFGVVYNSARISLAERSRELATLRVMGFTRAEVSMILLGELALLTAIAIPLGMAIGYTLAATVTWAMESELFRIPLIVSRSTLGFAAVVVIIAVVVSGLVVRRQIDHLDLVGVLKTRE